ncbi:MAG: alpha/beta fold hydrolase [Bacteroidota bacterium]
MLITILLLLNLGALLGFLYHQVNFRLPLNILQPGRREGVATPADFGLAYDHFLLAVAPAVELDCFFVPATTAPKANLIILHGVGSSKEAYLPQAEALCAMGYNLFMADQRAHGKSTKKHLSYGHYEKVDVRKMTDWLAEKTGDLRTGIYGNSMGGAVALQSLDHDHRLAFGLIESTFTDLPTVTRAYAKRMGLGWLPDAVMDFVLRRAGILADFDPWSIRPVSAARQLHQPVQFIHGDADQRIDPAHARQLFAACGSTDKDLYLVPGGDHTDLWEVGDPEYPKRFFGFLRRMAG